MINFQKKGDLFDAKCEALVNSVNCVGVMGRGVALQFKKTFPDNFKAYAAACKRGELQPGKVFVFELNGHLPPLRYIINLPTKRHWREKSRMEDLERSVDDLVRVIRAKGIRSVAMPPLAVGLGGLPWEGVKKLLQRSLASLDDVEVVIFEPNDRWVDKAPNCSKDAPAMTTAIASIIGLMDHYLEGLIDTEVTLLEVHKLLYFMQKAGEPLRLNYVKESHGPYAKNLRHVLRRMEGHWTAGLKAGDQPAMPLKLLPGARGDALKFLDEERETKERFDRVAALVEGFEFSDGLELLATVHWVAEEASEQAALSAAALTQKVHAWAPHKAKFDERQVGLALQTLQEQGWLGGGAR